MKKLIILLFAILPLGMFAQDMKIAYVDFQGVMFALPDFATFQTKMGEISDQYEKELSVMREEYTKKSSALIAENETLAENIRLRRMQEIQDIDERIQNFLQVAQQEMNKKQQELIQPIQEKVSNAIDQVGKEQGYTYVVDPQVFHFIGDKAIDATPLVRQKLGI